MVGEKCFQQVSAKCVIPWFIFIRWGFFGGEGGLHTLKFASREKVELGVFVTRIFGLEGWRLQLFFMPSF